MTPEQKLFELVELKKELEERLKDINWNIADLCNGLATKYAKMKVGERIENGGNTYQITSVMSSIWGNSRLDIRYYGRKVLKNGKSLHKNEQRLYFWETPTIDKGDTP